MNNPGAVGLAGERELGGCSAVLRLSFRMSRERPLPSCLVPLRIPDQCGHSHMSFLCVLPNSCEIWGLVGKSG